MDGISKRTSWILTMVTAAVSLLIVSACEHDFYETGDSGLSYLHTDFVEARTNTLSAFVSASTDDGIQLTLQPALKEKWATKGDTTYRALLYYNKVENGVTEPVAIRPVAVLPLRLALNKPVVHNDPVGFESAWMSKNGSYLNLGLILKTGKKEGKQPVQSVAVVCDSIKLQPSGGRMFYLRLHHHQNGVPEYYSSRVFASIPLAGFKKPDSITLDINTYKGKIRKYFAY
ncbi:NigD1/NigD2 family lipoprotein [Prevotella fusca]